MVDTHDHDHSHALGHVHGTGSRMRLGIAAALTGGFMIVEIAGGVYSGSLALLADAGHMFTDTAALGLAWFAAHLTARPADWKRTYGFDRFSILSAFVNGLALFVIAGLILYEAIQRMISPVNVIGPAMFAIATAGLVVNIASFFVLHGGDKSNLNVRAAALHVMGDLLGSVAAMVAAVIIMFTGWTLADPILSVLVAALILRSAWLVVRDSGRILLEAAPEQLDGREVGRDIIDNVKGVLDVHHVHIWSISEGRPMITLHARVRPADEAGRIVASIKTRIREQFGIDHATVEVETDVCADTSASGAHHAHEHAH